MPPPLPTQKTSKRKVVVVAWIGVSSILFLCALVVVALRVLGLVQPFSIPSAGMAPTVNQSDQIYTERLTYLLGKPHRGDVVVFRTDAVLPEQPHQLYLKRLVGLPGDTLNIANGVLHVNGQPAVFNGKTVTIPKYGPMGLRYLADAHSTVKVPENQYFVLGDNLANSIDSRYFGCLSADAVVSRAFFCYLSKNHVGMIH